MSSINAVGGNDSTWSSARAPRVDRPSGTPSPVKFKEAPFTTLDADGSGDIDARELDSLLNRLSQRSVAAASSAVPAATATTTFGQMDSDSSGSLSRYELDSGLKSLLGNATNTVAFASARNAQGAQGADAPPKGPPPGPPPPRGGGQPGGQAGATASSGSTSNSTATDPLDTNGDGTVSATEKAAGEAKQALQKMLKALGSTESGAVAQGSSLSVEA